MFGPVFLEANAAKGVLVLPWSALRERGGGGYTNSPGIDDMRPSPDILWFQLKRKRHAGQKEELQPWPTVTSLPRTGSQRDAVGSTPFEKLRRGACWENNDEKRRAVGQRRRSL